MNLQNNFHIDILLYKILKFQTRTIDLELEQSGLSITVRLAKSIILSSANSLFAV